MKFLEYSNNFPAIQTKIILNASESSERKNIEALAADAPNGVEERQTSPELSNIPSIGSLFALTRLCIELRREVGGKV